MAETEKPDVYGHINALIIDDDRSMLTLVASVLHSLGINRITSFSNPRSAVDVIESAPNTFDLIVCDWSMPDVTGDEILKRVRQDNSTVAFIMLTANVMSDAVKEARDLGVDAYVAKPFRTDDLQAKIRTVLAKRGTKLKSAK